MATRFFRQGLKKAPAEEDSKERDTGDPELSQAEAARQHFNLCNSLSVLFGAPIY